MIAGVVLTGGRSTRMGADKAFVEVRGVAMAAHVAGVLVDAGCEPVWCQGGDVERLRGLGLLGRPDPQRYGGPLAAIADALDAARAYGAQLVAVSACDLPELDVATIDRLREAALLNDQTLVAVATDQRGTHLLGVWRVAAVEPLRRLLGLDVASYRAAVERLGSVQVQVEPLAVHNANRPDELPGPR